MKALLMVLHAANSGCEFISSIASLCIQFTDTISFLAHSFILSTTFATVSWAVSGG